MRIRLLTISERQPAWVNDGFVEYAKRLPKHLAPELVELPLAKRGKGGDSAKHKVEESERLLNAMGRDVQLIALDERGIAWTSVQLAEQMRRWTLDGRDVALAIGGPDGHAPFLLERASARWSLSPLTLPHGLVRVVIAEQLYRAHSILEGHPYHRA
ncbi:MAG: 23S rRNA (pseudouridine(1915)-N(3))-methyltransferase RlmH [Rhodanobacteraceae bacterium]|nr:23S rRNA (pseudouridine(1915)-N(3))-methyltransferase RlmH [Rhodanobacteraceae bacterium]